MTPLLTRCAVLRCAGWHLLYYDMLHALCASCCYVHHAMQNTYSSQVPAVYKHCHLRHDFLFGTMLCHWHAFACEIAGYMSDLCLRNEL